MRTQKKKQKMKKTKISNRPLLLSTKGEVEVRSALESINGLTDQLQKDKTLIKESIVALKEFNPELYQEINQIYKEALKTNIQNRLFFNKYQVNKALIYGFRAYDKNETTNYFLKVDDVLGLTDANFVDGTLSTTETIEEYLKVLEIDSNKYFRDMEMDPNSLLLYVDDKADLTDKFAIDSIYHITSPTKLTAIEFKRKFKDYTDKFPDEISATFEAARKLSMDIPDEFRAVLNMEDRFLSILNSENKMISGNKARLYLSLLIIRSMAKKYNMIVERLPILKQQKEELDGVGTKIDDITKLYDIKKKEYDEFVAMKEKEHWIRVDDLAKAQGNRVSLDNGPSAPDNTTKPIFDEGVKTEQKSISISPILNESIKEPLKENEKKLKEGIFLNSRGLPMKEVTLSSGKKAKRLAKDSEAYEPDGGSS